jgi:hypothetical protein
MPNETPNAATETNTGVLDAINFALDNDGASPPISDETPAATETDETPITEGDGEASETPAEGEEGAEGAEGEVEGEGTEDSGRNPDGTFKKKAAEADPNAKKPEGDKPGVEKKAPDAINDPIPKELKVETQERIRSLISMAKESKQQAEKVTQDFEYLVKGVQATGATPEQYGEALSWLALLNSQDPAQQTKALELVESVADRLATMLGKERTMGDPLAQHEDLKRAVQAGQITQQYARETARLRNSNGFRETMTAQQRQEQEQRQQQEQATAGARQALNDLEGQLRASDPQYEAKREQLVPILKPLFQNMHPSQWPAAFQQAYANVRVAAPAVAKKPAVPTNQPMRAGKSSAPGGTTKQAGSALDVVNAALSNLAARSCDENSPDPCGHQRPGRSYGPHRAAGRRGADGCARHARHEWPGDARHRRCGAGRHDP